MQLGDQLVWEWWWRKVPSVLLYYHPCIIYTERTQVRIVLFYTKSATLLESDAEQCCPVW